MRLNGIRYSSVIHNLSQTGACLQTQHHVPSGAVVEIEFYRVPQDDCHQFQARVVHVRPGLCKDYMLGLRFEAELEPAEVEAFSGS